MPRLLPIAFIVSLAAGCSALPESARRSSLVESPLRRLADDDRPMPLNASSDDQATSDQANTADPGIAAKWTPDELIVGTGVRERIAREQKNFAQRWEPAFATDHSVPWAIQDSEETCRTPCENAVKPFAKLVPLPEPSTTPVAEPDLEQGKPEVAPPQIDNQAPSAPMASLASYTPAFQSVYVAAPALKENRPAKPVDPPETAQPTVAELPGSEADSRIDQILTKLQSSDRLRLNRVCLCQQVDGFGQLVEFPDANFAATEDVLIYCEVGNFKSVTESSPKGTIHRSSLSGSFVVTDLEGDVVAEQEYAAVDDLSQSERDDFYLVFPAKIPDLSPGNYRLYLVVHDELGNDLTAHDQPIQFQVAFPNRIQR